MDPAQDSYSNQGEMRQVSVMIHCSDELLTKGHLWPGPVLNQ